MRWGMVFLLFFVGCFNSSTQQPESAKRDLTGREAGLPDRINLQKLPKQEIEFGKKLPFSISFSLPDGEKVNELAPSAIYWYEKIGGSWNSVSTQSLRGLKAKSAKVRLKGTVELSSESAPIALDVKVYHCREDNKGVCVISSFRQIFRRKKQASQFIRFDAKLPKIF